MILLLAASSPPETAAGAFLLLSVDHEKIGTGPKIGVRAYARTPIFGYSFNFREVLTLEK